MRFGPIRLFVTLYSGFAVLSWCFLVMALSLADRTILSLSVSLPGRYPMLTRLDTSGLAQASIFEDSTDANVEVFYTQNRIVMSLPAIPQRVQNAFIAAEDAGFWHEPGISVEGILRSGATDIDKSGRPSGASTIPQQVIKNLVMGNPRMTLAAKLDEAILAIQATEYYGRPKLLELYLNEIYLGDGAYGIAAAAETYFGRSPSQLDLAQTAMLAGLPKSPNEYNPFLHPQAARMRRAYVLAQMVKDGFIDVASATAAASEDLQNLPNSQKVAIPKTITVRPVAGQPVPTGTSFTNAAEPEVTMADLESGSDADGGADSGMGWVRDLARRQFLTLPIDHDGDTVHLTIDPRIEILAERALQWGLLSWDMAHHGWQGSLGRERDGILPSRPAGSPSWLHLCQVVHDGRGGILVHRVDAPAANPTELHSVSLAGISLATGAHYPGPGDIVLAGQPWPGDPWQVGDVVSIDGSLVAIDPDSGGVLGLAGGFFHTASAFDRATQGLRQPGSAFKPFIYLAAAESGMQGNSLVLDAPISLSQGHGIGLWDPADDDDPPMGIVSLNKALAMSLNDAAIRMLFQIGLPETSQVSSAFGLYPQIVTYTAALGAQDISNWQLTGGYAGLAAGGRFTPPHLISNVIGRNGSTIWQAAPSQQVAPQAAVQVIETALQGTLQYGTAANLADLAKKFPDMAGKTGTAQNYTNAVFEGFLPNEIAVGVFVGYDKPKPLGEKAYGAVVAAPIWKWFMERYVRLSVVLPDSVMKPTNTLK